MRKLYDFFIQIPVRFLEKWRKWQMLPFLLVFGLSVFSLFQLNIASEEKISLPENHTFAKLEKKYQEYFASSDFILVTLESSSLFQKETLEAVRHLTMQLQQVAGIQSIISVVTANDLEMVDNELKSIPLFQRPVNPTFVRERLSGNSLFNHYLVSDDGRLFSIYLFPVNNLQIDNSVLVNRIQRIIQGETEYTVKMFGNRVIEHQLKQTIVRDFLFLGSLALVLVFLVQWLFTRSLRQGGLLLASSLLAAVITVALFPLLHMPLRTTTIMVPVIVLALSTSYNIHLYRYYVIFAEEGLTVALKHTVPVVFFTGLSTLLGFSTLLLSPVNLLRQFGTILLAGIIISILVALFFLPPLLQAFKPGSRVVKKWVIPLFGRPVLIGASLLLALVIGLLGLGVPRISYDYRLFSLFAVRNPVYQDSLYFHQHYRGLDELELIIDSGEEYGLVNVGLYQLVQQVEKEISSLQGISRVISFTSFVDWLNAKMNLPGEDPIIDSEEIIGENLELIFSNETGLPIGTLIDINYRYAKILIRFGTASGASSRQAVGLYRDLTASINQICNKTFRDVSWNLMGYSVQNEMVIQILQKSQFVSIIIFMVIFFLILLVRFKSLKIIFLVLLPGICNVVFFTGIMGWLTIPLSASVLVAMAAVMGVSVDDALYFMLFYRLISQKGVGEPVRQTLELSGKAIIHTTVIIVLGISVLLLSLYVPVIQTGLLIMGSLIFADFITLFIIPGLIRYAVNPQQKTTSQTGGSL